MVDMRDEKLVETLKQAVTKGTNLIKLFCRNVHLYLGKSASVNACQCATWHIYSCTKQKSLKTLKPCKFIVKAVKATNSRFTSKIYTCSTAVTMVQVIDKST